MVSVLGVAVVVGIGVALGVTRFLASFLYGVRAGDPLTLVAVAGLLAMVALAACYKVPVSYVRREFVVSIASNLFSRQEYRACASPRVSRRVERPARDTLVA